MHMKSRSILSALIPATILLIAFSAGEQANPPEPAYVGAKKCKVCHVVVFNSWSRTAHAQALEALREEGAGKPGCLECHTTGFGKGGYGADKTIVDLGAVQCEACHGPGSLYSFSSVMLDREFSRKAGLGVPDSVTCAGCHNTKSPTFKGFSFEAGLRAGTHSRKRY
jgi:hypothetical protein